MWRIIISKQSVIIDCFCTIIDQRSRGLDYGHTQSEIGDVRLPLFETWVKLMKCNAHDYIRDIGPPGLVLLLDEGPLKLYWNCQTALLIVQAVQCEPNTTLHC